MKRSRMGMALASAGLLGFSTLTAAAPAFADYGKTAVYQVELSANISGQHGGGVWLWLELSNDGSVDYTGSDCGHGGQGYSSERTWPRGPSGEPQSVPSLAACRHDILCPVRSDEYP
jgi:hypothetical protein